MIDTMVICFSYCLILLLWYLHDLKQFHYDIDRLEKEINNIKNQMYTYGGEHDTRDN